MRFLPWHEWVEALRRAVTSVPDAFVVAAEREVRGAGLVLTAGNGGSSAIASHLAQAVAKPRYEAGGGRPAVCLTDNTAVLTAHANDGGHETALLECARPFFRLRPVVVVVSSSGSSRNVVALARAALVESLRVVALTGFAGQPLRELATVSLHVDSDDYEVVEPAHDAILHRLQYHLREAS